MTKKFLAVGMLLAAAMATTGAAQAATTFTDVPSDHWAAAAISWAADAGLMKGPDNMPGMFDPAGLANRAQLAVVFQRFTTMMDQKLADIYTKIDALTKAMADNGNLSQNLLTSGMLNKTFVANLTSKQETPSTSSNGTGTGYFMLTSEGLHYNVEFTGLTGSVTAAHIHTGAIGVAGPARHSIQFTNGVASGTWKLADMTKDDLTMLLNGDVYVNIHTNSFGDGEIRGQLMNKKAEIFHGMLTADQQTGDVTSTATGMVHAALYGNNLVYMVSYKGLTTAFSAAHFHTGAIGENGSVSKEISCDTSDMMCSGVWTNLSDADKQALWSGNMYVNVHTTKYPNGEIRAQLMMW